MKKIMLLLFLLSNFLSFANSAPLKLVVLLDWFTNPNHAPLYIAKEQGFFQQEGLDVELIQPADPSDPPKLVAAGKADIGITYEPQFIQQVDQRLPLIAVGMLIEKPLACLVVLKDGPIKTLVDLKNKRIGFSTGDANSLNLRTMLKKAGLTLKNVEEVNVNYNLTQALLAKNIDAATGMMRNFELIQMQLAGQPGRPFFPEDNGVPTYSELIFIAHTKRVHDSRLIHFLNAEEKAVNYIRAHPQESWQQFIKNHPELNDELNKRAWKVTIPYFAIHPAQFNLKNWQTFAEFMRANGLISQVQPITRYVAKQ